ncbi:MAG TPA: GNAT family N-acetyltransferase [Hyphomicrobiaceae bacterium]|nr:GNAT family N-acetyltransferase [Hyphomicrobiaceae bacterium]
MDDNLDVRPLTARAAATLAQGMAAIDPWRRLGISAHQLEQTLLPGETSRALAAPDQHAHMANFEVWDKGEPAGLLSLRENWLYGPYIRLLAVLPDHQGTGLGGCLLDWTAQRALRAGETNLWVCASGFNGGALRFYEVNGFRPVGRLTDLVVTGEHEVLLRRRL